MLFRFLEKETRKRFFEAVNIVDNYSSNLLMLRDTQGIEEKKKINEMILENWEKFHGLYSIIFSEVELEPIKLDGDKIGPLGDTSS